MATWAEKTAVFNQSQLSMLGSNWALPKAIEGQRWPESTTTDIGIIAKPKSTPTPATPSAPGFIWTA